MDHGTRTLPDPGLLPDRGTGAGKRLAAQCLVALVVLLTPGLHAVAPRIGSADDPSRYSVELIHDNLFLAVGLRFAPDGRIFFIELWTGRVKYYPDTSRTATASTWATLPVYAGGERGLLGITFHPEFADSPYVYLFHTLPDSLGGYNRVVRMTDSAGIGTQPTVIRDLGTGTEHHNGGRLAFGPDGNLYVTHGDADTTNNADDPNSIRGKVLRYTPMGEPAPDNPFGPGNPVYAYGIRNAFGLCFDSQTGEGYFTENGPDCDDEVNHLLRGGDYGWGLGDFCDGQPPGTILPMLNYTPTIAPTGCWVYRGSGIPAMNGNLFFGGFNDGTLRRAFVNASSPGMVDSVQDFYTAPDEFMDVTQGTDGYLWILMARRLYRVRPDYTVDVAEGPRPQAALSAWPNPFRGSLTLSLPALPLGASTCSTLPAGSCGAGSHLYLRP